MLPFVITFNGQRMTGTIDRLCELEDGTWVVIDYKSDPVDPPEYSKKAGTYRTSMDLCVEAARQLLGGNVVEGWLYFTDLTSPEDG